MASNPPASFVFSVACLSLRVRCNVAITPVGARSANTEGEYRKAARENEACHLFFTATGETDDGCVFGYRVSFGGAFWTPSDGLQHRSGLLPRNDHRSRQQARAYACARRANPRACRLPATRLFGRTGVYLASDELESAAHKNIFKSRPCFVGETRFGESRRSQSCVQRCEWKRLRPPSRGNHRQIGRANDARCPKRGARGQNDCYLRLSQV